MTLLLAVSLLCAGFDSTPWMMPIDPYMALPPSICPFCSQPQPDTVTPGDTVSLFGAIGGDSMMFDTTRARPFPMWVTPEREKPRLSFDVLEETVKVFEFLQEPEDFRYPGIQLDSMRYRQWFTRIEHWLYATETRPDTTLRWRVRVEPVAGPGKEETK